MIYKKGIFLWCCLCAAPVLAWDANGHALITQLAYSYLTPQAKQKLYRYTESKNISDLIKASIWLDQHRYGRYKQFSTWHYINIPYGDAEYFKPANSNNLLTAIHAAQAVLQSKTTTVAEKRMAVRVLMHCLEDLHQPLHTISYYSKRYKQGDRGANLWKIKNKVYKGNLHHFWDMAGGWLSGYTWQDQESMALRVKELGPISCDPLHINVKLEAWVKQSYALAEAHAYFPPRATHKFIIYRNQVQQYSKNQIKVAACRLAATLNQIMD